MGTRDDSPEMDRIREDLLVSESFDRGAPLSQPSREAVTALNSADRLVERQIRSLTIRIERQKKDSEAAAKELQELLKHASPHHVRRPATLWREKYDVYRAYSLHAELLRTRLHASKTGRLPLYWLLDDKNTGHKFIDLFEGVTRPEVLSVDTPIAALQIRTGVVVKPENGAGARGCYLPIGDKVWRHVKTGEVVDGIETLRAHAQALTNPRLNRTPLQDLWKTERLISEDQQQSVPGRDVKFYSFYGKVGLVFEIVRHPRKIFRAIDPITGEYLQPFRGSYDYEEGAAVRPEDLELVSAISKEIPTAFMSIDMLRSSTGLVFNEFTPHPIATRDLTPVLDRRLGSLFYSAQQDLTEDLLAGKQFERFSVVQEAKI